MKLRRYINCLLWLICTYILCSCAYETVQTPTSNKDVDYAVVEIDENFISTADTPFSKIKAPPPKKDSMYDYVLGGGDYLLINLYVVSANGQTGLTRIIPQAPALPSENKFLVAADGTITVPYAGKIKVGGKPFIEVKKLLDKRMHKFFLNPQLDMRVADFASSRVLISGEVKNPQELTLSHKPLTVMAAITAAGGALPTADLRDAKIVRANGAEEKIDVAALIYDGKSDYNKVLLAGDSLNIPRNHANQLFVIGEAMDAKTLTLNPSGTNLTQALGEVKGLNPETAKPSAVYVLREHVGRRADKREVSVYHMDASDPKSYVFATKFAMQPQDVIYIGSRDITDWGRFIGQLLPGGIAGLVQPAPYILN